MIAIALTGGFESEAGGEENTAAAAAARDVRLAGVKRRRRPRGDGEPPAVFVVSIFLVLFCLCWRAREIFIFGSIMRGRGVSNEWTQRYNQMLERYARYEIYA